MNTIKYNASTLAAVALAISTEETRYYLNGVMLNGITAVATDGHLMTVAVDDSNPIMFDHNGDGQKQLTARFLIGNGLCRQQTIARYRMARSVLTY